MKLLLDPGTAPSVKEISIVWDIVDKLGSEVFLGINHVKQDWHFERSHFSRFYLVIAVVIKSRLGTTIIRELHLGARFARSEEFDCVTNDGDQISRRGALIGGYIDTKKSKLELHKTIRAQQMNRDQLQDLTRWAKAAHG
ncbi:hypothetical protein OESDEN_06776 [Oesophagostomum dentatum]|uniref:Uncharacterized protein n=1 Tax=Oesophagostomum dentatum TaxID=61180 RepID=A0A0B1TBW2_OESDE|nr:hypothetical protein OESDEN_06776 [Oesophagostomum dentatum]